MDFAPPAPPLRVAAFFPAAQCGVVCASPDWGAQVPHPAPWRQLCCNRRGEYEVTASDGTTRRFPAGALLLLEDRTGKGHATRITRDDDVFHVAVALAD